MAPPLRHVYVHIPFCHRICPYCSFFKHQPGSTDISAFLEALIKEARTVRRDHPLAIESIYFGGGTPSMLSTRHFTDFLPAFVESLGRPEPAEWTLEANPMTFDSAKASVWKAHGINRVSLGVQAWDQPTLQTLGRDHSPEHAESSVHILKEIGFDTVNIDLMFSIPGQSIEAWEDTLSRTIALQPDHISTYNLNYEEDTEFFDRLKRGVYRQDDDADVPFFETAMAQLAEAGFDHYEISNYAKPRKQSRHNRAYWKGADFIGLGPSAFSTMNRKRWQNICDTGAYIQEINQDQSAALPGEDLDDASLRCERIALELRTSRGISREMIGTGRDEVLATLAEAYYIELSETHVRLTNSGKLLADAVACELL
jgi:oxygen-independent coproporphyrinogen-3 oxidase